MQNLIFFNSYPFVIDVKKKSDVDIDRVPFDRPTSDETNQIRQQVLQWCVSNKLLTVVSSDTLAVNIQSTAAGGGFGLYDTNFRLINFSDDQIIKFLDSLKDGSFLERVKNLAIHLVMSNPPDVVDYHITQIYRALSILPPDDAPDLVPWSDVHKKYPFFWVLPLVRMVMVEAAAPIAYKK